MDKIMSDLLPDDNKSLKKVEIMSCAKDFLNQANEFRIHTGNVISWKELKQRNFSNPSDELIECLRLQISQWKPEANSLIPGQGICLCNNKQYCWPAEDSGYKRNELKITLKLYLQEYNPDYVNACFDAATSALNTDFVDMMIIAFPAEDDDLDLAKAKPIWQQMEQLAAAKKVNVLGVADLDYESLEAFYNACDTFKPAICHYNIDACCSVPPELTDYSKAHHIQLLTHNDPMEFLPREKVVGILKDDLGVTEERAKMWKAEWVSRYTVMIKERSVIQCKAYMVQMGVDK